MSKWLWAAQQAGLQSFSRSAISVDTVYLPHCGENAGNAEFADELIPLNTAVVGSFEERAAAELGQPETELLNRPGEASEENDPEVLLAFLRARGPATYGAAATDLGWGATRASRAMSSLKRQGRVRLGSLREAIPIQSDALAGATRDE